MKIKSVRIKGFRGYAEAICVDMSDLLVLVGKNDVGKSTVLEALDLFFNEGKGTVKLDKEDINKDNARDGDDMIEISVEFSDLPDRLVIDATNETSLSDEYLLTEADTLLVTKRYPKAGAQKVFIVAHHPTAESCRDLLLKKQTDLKKLLDEQSIECADKTRNAEIRKAIWAAQETLALGTVEVEVAKIDAKNIWDQLKAHMPLFSLFQSDRKNSDGDSEVQDPMRLAVREILGDPAIQAALANVADTVKTRLDEVAAQTLAKLSELNPEIASSLNPRIPEHGALKWGDVFKSVAIAGDEEIPINKRGSGVKRLILISFFRAEAERRRRDSGLPGVVYAIEEPETSQHPDHQRALIDALIQLSEAPDTQIILTTHSPEIVKRLEFDHLLLIAGQRPEQITKVRANELPYPSLNEVNFAAFDETSVEYHNELYGFLEAEGKWVQFASSKPTVPYNRLKSDGSTTQQQIPLTTYIRHQIHHPENTHNPPYTQQQLRQSIEDMRAYIKDNL
ncbi:ATP-binding protein [bacterium]|nr:ATP-binding protein [bacterium]